MTIVATDKAPSASERASSSIEVIAHALTILGLSILAVAMFFSLVFTLRTESLNSDVHQIAIEVNKAVMNDPEATTFAYTPPERGSKNGAVAVGNSPAVTFEVRARHANIFISAVDQSGAKVANGDPDAMPGEYIIEACSTKNWGWGGGTADDPITYESRVGQIVVPRIFWSRSGEQCAPSRH